MTFKEMIYKGLCDKTVEIINNPNDDCIACQIGDYWFYFIGNEYEDLTPYEVYESFTKEELTDMIYSALMGMEKNCLADEVDYYKAFLAERYESSTSKKEIDWMSEFVSRIAGDKSDIWSDGTEILCKTESAADAIASLIEKLYESQGEEVFVSTGYYDPEEDKQNGEEDDYTGWWYVDIQ